jgi:hypothetical protein
VYHSQVLKAKFFSADHKVHEQQFSLKAEGVTEFELLEGFKTAAVLLNSSNLGYARVLLDSKSTQYFLENLSTVESQLDRTYIWMLLYDQVKMCKVTPVEYLKCFLRHV